MYVLAEQIVEEKSTSVQYIQYGDILQVKRGASVPVDGEVVHGRTSLARDSLSVVEWHGLSLCCRWGSHGSSAGESTVDESLLTGEALPVPKKPGDTVIGTFWAFVMDPLTLGN